MFKVLLCSVCCAVVLTTMAFADLSADTDLKAQMPKSLGGIPVSFTKNMGQWPDSILFRADISSSVLWFTSDGMYYQFTKRIEEADVSHDPKFDKHPPLERYCYRCNRIERLLIGVKFVDANPTPIVTGKGLLKYKRNYFLGNDPAKWFTDVPNYSAIVLRDIYPGIDLRYSGNSNGEVEYEIIAAPGSDISQIRVAYEGDINISINDEGRFVIKTVWGNEFEAIQIDGEGFGIASPRFVSNSDGSHGVIPRGNIGDLVSSKDEDVALVYSTFLGGEEEDKGIAIAIDGSGCAYVTGKTDSPGFPTENPYDPVYDPGGYTDVFVTKFSSSGQELEYSTFLGGSGLDWYGDIAVDDYGCAYVTGMTICSDFPLVNAFDPTLESFEVFVTKFSPSGNTLEYSTYLGGSDWEFGMGIAVDITGCVYVAGYTLSSDFLVYNSFDDAIGGYQDGFVTKFTPSGDDVMYSTFLGGDDEDVCYAITVDDAECAHVTGRTDSPDFPVQNAAYPNHNDYFDVFVTKFTLTGSDLVFSTFLGGSEYEDGLAIAVDDWGFTYVTGQTESSDFPTRNAYDDTYGGGDGDVFVSKLSETGSQLIYSTFLGDTGYDCGRGIDVDASGCAYVTGNTWSWDFPTEKAFDWLYGTNSDAFVTKFSSWDNALVYSTFLGGYGGDGAEGIVVDNDGCAYVTGSTESSSFPTEDALYPDPGGNIDAFVTKLTHVPEQGKSRCGDANYDDVVDIDDVVYLIEYIFTGGPEPVQWESGDVNCSEMIDIDDVVYLINYLFMGDSAPCDPDGDGEPNC